MIDKLDLSSYNKRFSKIGKIKEEINLSVY